MAKATIKGAKLLNATGHIIARGRRVDFENLGVPRVPTPSALNMRGYKTANFVDPDQPDSVEITQQPSIGKAGVTPDGEIILDMLGADPNSNVTFQYRKSKGGVLTLVDANVAVAEAAKKAGWGKGAFYKPMTKNKAVIARPNETTRRFYIDNEGLTWSQIRDREGGTMSYGQTLAFVKDNYASTPLDDGEGGTFSAKYGTHPELAIEENFALTVFGSYYKSDNNQNAIHILFKRGGTYDASNYSGTHAWLWERGHSANHPLFVGSYGEGELPVFTVAPGIMRTACYAIIQDGQGQRIKWDAGNSHMVLDNWVTHNVTHGIEIEGGPVCRGLTVRRLKVTDAFYNSPKNGSTTEWEYVGNGDRTGGSYISYITECLFEDIFFDMCGWNEGYHADWVYHDETSGLYFPQTPSIYSHCVYAQYNYNKTYWQNIMAFRGALNGIQFRGGGVIQGLLLLENNSFMSVGNSDHQRDPSDNLLGFGTKGKETTPNRYTLGNVNSDSMVDDVVCSIAGYHQYWQRRYFNEDQQKWIEAQPAPSQFLALGIQLADGLTGLKNGLVINHEPNRVGLNTTFDGPDTIGPCVHHRPNDITVNRAVSDFMDNDPVTGQQPDPSRFDVQIAKWNPCSPDYRVDGISETVKELTTIAEYENQKTGSTGKTHYDFYDRLRASDAPWEERQEVNDWMRGRMGNNVTRRTTPKTMNFKKNAWGWSPGFLANVKLDWSENGLDGLPGDVAGDSVDTFGALYLVWNITPTYDLEELTLRKTLVEVPSGHLMATTALNLIGASQVVPTQGGAFSIPGYSGADKLTIGGEISGGLFFNTGTVDGNVDIIARHSGEFALSFDGSDFFLGDGDTMTVYGGAKVGWDGKPAEVGFGQIICEEGSTTRFKPSMELFIDTTGGIRFTPKIGEMLTGTGGDIGVVREVQLRPENRSKIILDDIQRVPALNELVSGVCIRDHDEHVGYQSEFGNVTNAGEAVPPVVIAPKISEFMTGLKGFDEARTKRPIEPDVPSRFIGGGHVEVDIACLENGDYTLIEADALSGYYLTASATSNAGKDITLTFDNSPGTLIMNISDGTGQVSMQLAD